MPKVGFVSLGCPKNLVDTEVMMGLLVRGGYELTPRAEEAEILVVNTCSFINPAKKESVDTILEMAEHKKRGTARKLIVTGCLVERYRDQICREIPEVDAVVGINEVERIVSVCQDTPPSQPGAQPVLEPYLYHDLTPRVLATPRHYAYIKINEGCDHTCSFCIIPRLRGPFRSRRFESVVAEAEQLLSQGVRELILVGQDTTWYGEDLGIRNGLALLLERLAQLHVLERDGGWIRFLYCYPNRVTQRLLETIAAWPALVKYLDIPLQHASASVLKRMRRGQDGNQFLRLLERIRRTIPGVALRTSMIVGFPGESDADFQELCQFVEAASFDRLGVFAYSDEEDTASYELDGKVDGRTIQNRRRRLLATQRNISRRKNRRLVGRTFALLLEGVSQESELLWEGRLASQAPEIDGKVLINDIAGRPPTAGSFVQVEITRALDYDLLGRVLPPEPSQRRAPVRAEPCEEYANTVPNLQDAH